MPNDPVDDPVILRAHLLTALKLLNKMLERNAVAPAYKQEVAGLLSSDVSLRLIAPIPGTKSAQRRRRTDYGRSGGF